MTTRPRQIIALGGGGFLMEPENPRLDRYVLRQSRKRRPSICFVPTASADSEVFIERFYAAFEPLPCRPSHLSLFKPPPKLESFLLEHDIVYVSGGNTKNMLALWREWGLDRTLWKAWRRGIVLCGVSAGSICWFEQGLTDSYPGTLRPLDCLGMLTGSNCPHFDGEPDRRPRYRRLIREDRMLGGLAADDGVALHFIGTKLAHVVSSRRGASAYRLDRTATGVEETRLTARYLRYNPRRPSSGCTGSR